MQEKKTAFTASCFLVQVPVGSMSKECLGTTFLWK